MHALRFSSLETPIGLVYVVSDGASVVETAFERPPYQEVHDAGGCAITQLKEYFKGERFVFDAAINLGKISTFYTAVYRALREIPYGTVCSYKELAAMAGSPSAARAVGQAMSHNPIPIILPCHRVIASDGSLGGYTGGISIKKKLLALERQAAGAGHRLRNEIP
ncbi:methylated-DNA--[protein]-cysteine S-methyltransferase [Candidatus Magnetominusculus xianensis]|uniref:Methylated-DNA--protein-cysteine methyltransferase n=1 Tax=Candidatus Magnetominusculus xianensis TaxID=1748249 RepID=A0ABR5SK99_9BACT|nr:methylated-DNA--[protein]-cysteine S-methyltransferase [Candidatus Magnetominusculus xianensis]KWT93558.1 methylated-DNA--protein-cysteine methyltransferase [Candidatus Magnetominusculus xianensis]MBF0405347.1 methylated-DNA--[protein]-cysteine S-methyltransferase [Nitrospirota bacterium]